MTSALPTAPRLRDFAVAVYGRDGVQAACLALQDAHGLDVNLVLFAAWTGAAGGRALGPDDLQEAEVRTFPWREEIVRPLRAVRRSLKAMRPSSKEREALRSQVKAAELQAELQQLDALEALAGEIGAAAAPGRDLAGANLAAMVAGLPETAAAAAAVIASACFIGTRA